MKNIVLGQFTLGSNPGLGNNKEETITQHRVSRPCVVWLSPLLVQPCVVWLFPLLIISFRFKPSVNCHQLASVIARTSLVESGLGSSALRSRGIGDAVAIHGNPSATRLHLSNYAMFVMPFWSLNESLKITSKSG